MRRLLSLFAAFCLLASLAGGAVVHASEAAGGSEVTEATEWLHGDSDHDQVPSDGDNAFPHHHNICHGHDLAPAARVAAAPLQSDPDGMLRRMTPAAPDSGPPTSLLRPPIA